jgi:hypothetical protein
MSYFEAIERLEMVSGIQKSDIDWETVFVDLNLSIAAGAGMGGEQDDYSLSYIYCALNIDHLLT